MVLPTDPAMLQDKRGMTLLEVMFSTAILTLALGLVFSVSSACMRSYHADVERNQATASARIAAEYIKRDLRGAECVMPSYHSEWTSSRKIVIGAPSYDSAGVITGSRDYIVYEVNDSDVLTRSVYPATGSQRSAEKARRLVKGIESIGFTYYAHDFAEGDASTTAFSLSADSPSSPMCRLDGATVTGGVTYSLASSSARFSAPPADGATLEFVYEVSCEDPSLQEAVSEVAVVVTPVDYSGTFTAKARLRNKR